MVPQGLEARGGIGRLALYLNREFSGSASNVRLRIISTRWTMIPFLKHLSTLPALAAFTWYCGGGKARIAHINIAPRGSTYRKFLFWSVAKFFGLKTVLHLHGSGYDEYFEAESEAVKDGIRRFFCAADHVVVLGEHWKSFIVERLGVSEGRVSIIANGVPDVNPGGEERQDPPLIASMGLVGERKGTDVLIEALAMLPGSVEWRAVIGGDGEVEKYRLMADAAGLRDKISFLGWVTEKEVDLWLNRASLFVLPSRAENQPIAILEAMARGLPVVATSIGAIPEQVIDGQTGILVPPGEAEPLRAALQILLESATKRAAFGDAGRTRYHNHFSITNCANRFRALYLSLAD